MAPHLDFNNIATYPLLLSMSAYKRSEREAILGQIRNAVDKTHGLLLSVQKPEFPALEDLTRIGAYKEKYVPYSAFFSSISSFPVLEKVCSQADLADTILGKVFCIMSIKVLDNLNDDTHTIEQALRSLDLQKRAFLEEDFPYRQEPDIVSKAENWTYLMARLTYEYLSQIKRSSPSSYRLFRKDMNKYIAGQKESFYQRADEGNTHLPRNLAEYLSSTCEKGIGYIWFDMDLVSYEAGRGELDDREKRMASIVRDAMGLAYKSALLYDDVSDLRDDLTHKIVNSVVLYAVDQGVLGLDEFWKDQDTTILKLEKAGVLRDVMHLGDLVFLRAMHNLEDGNTCFRDIIDVDGIAFGFRVLRAFTMRKWVMRERSLTSLGALARSFYSSSRLKRSIPSRLLEYEEFIESSQSKQL